MRMRDFIRRLRGTLFVEAVIVFSLLFSASGFAASKTGRKSFVKTPKRAVILVGDSRVRHMVDGASSKSRKDFCLVWASGYGIGHLKSNGGGLRTNLLKAMKKYPSATVVFMLGVNQNSAKSDGARLKVYDSFIKSKKYGKHRFIVSTVGKTVGLRGNYANSRVKDFNRKIKAHYAGRADVRIYDLYAFLDGRIRTRKDTRNGDGLHYKSGTLSLILQDLRRFTG